MCFTFWVFQVAWHNIGEYRQDSGLSTLLLAFWKFDNNFTTCLVIFVSRTKTLLGKWAFAVTFSDRLCSPVLCFALRQLKRRASLFSRAMSILVGVLCFLICGCDLHFPATVPLEHTKKKSLCFKNVYIKATCSVQRVLLCQCYKVWLASLMVACWREKSGTNQPLDFCFY